MLNNVSPSSMLINCLKAQHRKSFHTFELFTILYSNKLQDSRSKSLVHHGLMIGRFKNGTHLCKKVSFPIIDEEKRVRFLAAEFEGRDQLASGFSHVPCSMVRAALQFNALDYLTKA